MTEQGYRLFYRIVRANPPTIRDFRSAQEKRLPEPSDPARRAVWHGVSVFSTLSQARRKRRTSPGIGDYIAVVRVPTDGSIRFERTLRDDGHRTIWAAPSMLLALVVSIEPV